MHGRDIIKNSDTWLLLALTVLAAIPRFWSFGSLGLVHFDEAVYAIGSVSVYADAFPEALVSTQRNSPPFLLLVAGAVMPLLGSNSELVLIGVSAFFGTLTIPLVYLVSLFWIGRPAAIGAGIIVALSDFHVAYSRMGLTDVTFLFLFLLALWLLGQAERRRSYAMAALAGVATGLAWNTKYHGWLAPAISGVALLPLLFSDQVRQFLRALPLLVIASVIAGLMYLPWFFFVDAQDGGYEALIRHHARFLHPERFWVHTHWHAGSQMFLDGWMGRIAPALALACILTTMRGVSGSLRWKSFLTWAPGLLLLGTLVGLSGVSVLLAVVGIVMLVRSGKDVRILLAFLLVFTVLTPLYHAYPRLLLPWICAVYIFGAAGLVYLAPIGTRLISGTRWTQMLAPASTAALAFAALFTWFGWRTPANTWMNSTGFRDAAVLLTEMVPMEIPILVVGEPSLVFYLKKLGYQAVPIDRPQQVLDHFSQGVEVFMVGGIYTRRSRRLENWLDQFAYAGHVSQVGLIPATVNNVRILNDFKPDSAERFRQNPGNDYYLQVFRFIVPAKN